MSPKLWNTNLTEPVVDESKLLSAKIYVSAGNCAMAGVIRRSIQAIRLPRIVDQMEVTLNGENNPR